MKKQHAIHNEEACKFLLTSKKFNDWVVTTAFYSALHFVQNELFPLTDNGQKYTDFNVYFGKVLKKKNKKLSKHSATIELVKINLPLSSGLELTSTGLKINTGLSSGLTLGVDGISILFLQLPIPVQVCSLYPFSLHPITAIVITYHFMITICVSVCATTCTAAH